MCDGDMRIRHSYEIPLPLRADWWMILAGRPPYQKLRVGGRESARGLGRPMVSSSAVRSRTRAVVTARRPGPEFDPAARLGLDEPASVLESGSSATPTPAGALGRADAHRQRPADHRRHRHARRTHRQRPSHPARTRDPHGGWWCSCVGTAVDDHRGPSVVEQALAGGTEEGSADPAPAFAADDRHLCVGEGIQELAGC